MTLLKPFRRLWTLIGCTHPAADRRGFALTGVGELRICSRCNAVLDFGPPAAGAAVPPPAGAVAPPPAFATTGTLTPADGDGPAAAGCLVGRFSLSVEEYLRLVDRHGRGTAKSVGVTYTADTIDAMPAGPLVADLPPVPAGGFNVPVLRAFDLTVERLVAPSAVLSAFIAKYGDASNGRDNTLLLAVGDVVVRLTTVVISSFGPAIVAAGMSAVGMSAVVGCRFKVGGAERIR